MNPTSRNSDFRDIQTSATSSERAVPAIAIHTNASTDLGTTPAGAVVTPASIPNLLPRGPDHFRPPNTIIPAATPSDAMAVTLSRPPFSMSSLPSISSAPTLSHLEAANQMSPRLQQHFSFSSAAAPLNQPSSPTSSYSSSASLSRGNTGRPGKDSDVRGNINELPPIRPYRSNSSLAPRSHHHDTEEQQQSDSSVRSHGIKRSYDTYATIRPPPIPTIYPKPTAHAGLPQQFSTPQSPIPLSTAAPIPPSTAAPPATIPPNPRLPLHTMPESRFTLHLRQNPRAARAGPDGKDRRTIDPPPVLQLLIDDFDPHEAKDIALLKAHDWVVHAKLISAEAPHEDLTTIATHPERGNNSKVTRLLLGTTVSSPFFCADDPDTENAPEHPKTMIAGPPSPTAEVLKIPNRNRDASTRRPDAYKTFPGAFFIFPDLSIRKAGQYRLEFRLMKMTPDVLIPGRIVPTISIAVSDIFNVVNAKDFDQVQPSTDLIKGLLDRGAGFPLKLKKGLREGQRRKGRGDSDDDDDDGDGDGDDNVRDDNAGDVDDDEDDRD